MLVSQRQCGVPAGALGPQLGAQFKNKMMISKPTRLQRNMVSATVKGAVQLFFSHHQSDIHDVMCVLWSAPTTEERGADS